MDKKIGIYKITNNINQKIYIGQSIDIFKRWKNEIIKPPNEYLKNSFKKYGVENFSFDILEECSEEELDDKEKYYISLFNSTNKNIGYNITFGGTGGKMPSDIIEKMKKTKAKNGYTKYWQGKKLPIEMKKKISNSLKEEKNPNFKKGANLRKVVCVETGEVFNSANDVYNRFNSKSKNIHTAIKNNSCCLGYHWKYLEEKPKILNKTTNEVFENTKDVFEKYGIDRSALLKACKGVRKTAGGFEWEFLKIEDL